MHNRVSLILLIVFWGCQNTPKESLINPSHLDNLYREIELNNERAAFICIYADYPSYNPVEAAGEGIACIDDVARAAIFYFRYYQGGSEELYLQKAKKLTQFILEFQTENGFYYNFIYADNTINTTRNNSQAKADWWTWRAMWALSEAMIYANKHEPSYYITVETAFMRSLNAVVGSGNAEAITGIPSDQASVLLLALTTYFNVSGNKKIVDYISVVANSIMKSQRGDEENFPYFAFMSWKKVWHAWGNVQSYALLQAGQILGDQNMIKAATNEVKYFYPYLLSQNHFKQFKLDDNDEAVDVESFEQIAYAIRPMVWASLELFRITDDSVYARQAGKLAAWLFGENITKSVIYDPKSGRCFDGINSANQINLNSGAESTIESLLTIHEVEKNSIAKDYLQSVYRKTLNE